MNDRYFTVDDMESHEQFIKIPLILLEDDFYKDLSNDAKIAYGVLSDRLTLSYKNKQNWTDENGRVYIVYTNEQLMQTLRKSENTVTKIKKELRKFGLLLEVRQGFQRPNLLYPQKPRTVKNTVQEPQNLQVNTVKSTVQEPQKIQPNQTKYNHTNINQIENNQAADESVKKAIQFYENTFGLITRMSEQQMVLDDIKEFGTDVYIEAIKTTIRREGKKSVYLEIILQDWRRNGVNTLEKAREYVWKNSNRTSFNKKESVRFEDVKPLEGAKF